MLCAQKLALTTVTFYQAFACLKIKKDVCVCLLQMTAQDSFFAWQHEMENHKN